MTSSTNYLLYLLELNQTRILRLAASGGSTFPNITKGELGDYTIQAPPLSEQEEIAYTLAIVEAKVSSEEQRKGALEELFRSALEQLMTGQIRLPV